MLAGTDLTLREEEDDWDASGLVDLGELWAVG
jgi:hypothetical protein